MTDGDRRALIGILAVATVLLMACTAFALFRRPRVTAGRPAPLRLDLNRAGVRQLMLLPGIGEARAKRIIAYRERVGEIRDPGELESVHGVSPAAAKRLRPFVTTRTATARMER